ncbi:MAG: BsuPI-related putative proteinase inhibitor [Chloroflexi bacterium]|nr:BsuPI-related putative proteinase inhibitor [Chloroflexota bacterium]
MLTRSEPGISLTLEIPDSISIGDPVTFEVVLKNTSDRSIEVEVSSPPTVDVVVLSTGGEQIWRHQPPLNVGTGGSVEIPASAVSTFDVLWNQLDDDGFASPPGPYLVRGFAHISENGLGRSAPINLATAAVPFTLTDAP